MFSKLLKLPLRSFFRTILKKGQFKSQTCPDSKYYQNSIKSGILPQINGLKLNGTFGHNLGQVHQQTQRQSPKQAFGRGRYAGPIGQNINSFSCKTSKMNSSRQSNMFLSPISQTSHSQLSSIYLRKLISNYSTSNGPSKNLKNFYQDISNLVGRPLTLQQLTAIQILYNFPLIYQTLNEQPEIFIEIIEELLKSPSKTEGPGYIIICQVKLRELVIVYKYGRTNNPDRRIQQLNNQGSEEYQLRWYQFVPFCILSKRVIFIKMKSDRLKGVVLNQQHKRQFFRKEYLQLGKFLNQINQLVAQNTFTKHQLEILKNLSKQIKNRPTPRPINFLTRQTEQKTNEESN